MKIAVVGSALAGGAIQIVDILLEDDLARSVRVYDDADEAQDAEILGVPVVGPLDRILFDFRDGMIDSAVVAVGSIAPRKKIFTDIGLAGIPLPNIISKRAVISLSSSMGHGNVVLPLVYIGPRVTVGNNNYFTTSSVINHDSVIGSHCYFSTSVSVAGRVSIGDEVRLDTASSVTADAVLPGCSLVGPGQSFGPTRGR